MNRGHGPPGLSDPSVTRLVLRSLFIQALWNPRDLQGSGLAWILDGVEPPPSEPRSPDPFNGHPYLSGVAAGALVREETEGRLDAADLARFQAALRAPLGALGDALVWAGWVPFLALLAMGALVLGAPPLLVAAGFLGIHNLLHLGLRRWGVQVGLRHGVRVGQALATSPLRPAGDQLRRGVVVLAGVVGGLAAVRGASILAAGVMPPVLSLAGAALLTMGVGYLLAGRLPAAMPLHVALLLLLVGWGAVLVGGG